MAQNSYQLINLNGDIVLSWPFSFQGGSVVADINDVATSQIQLACYGATTANLVAIYNNGVSGVGATLTNNGSLAAFAVDGVSPPLNARILVKNQSPLSNQNGIYTLTTVGDGVSIAWVLTRATDYDSPSEMQKGDFVPVTNGTVNANTKWVQTATIVSVGISSPNFTMRNNGWTITLPDATLAINGQAIIVNSVSSPTFQILLNDGTTLLTNVTSGQVFNIYLSSNLTTNGSWRVIPAGGGTNAITSLTAQSSDSTIVISGSPISPPSGALDFKLPTSLSNLNNVNTTGFPIITATAPLAWTTRTLLGGSNIQLDNGNGIANNPVINLSDQLTSINSISFTDGLTIDDYKISNSATNGAVQINSTGTGNVSINNVSIDTSSNITGINNLTVNGTFTNPRTPKVLFTFTDTTVGPSNVMVIQDKSNVSTIVNSGSGTYTITFSTPLTSTNYGVFLGLGSTGGIAPLVSHAYWTVKNVNSVVIVVVDASGVPVMQVPNGITGMIMLSV
jgi:hypothetical protein